MFAQVREVGILREPFEIAVAIFEGAFEGFGGLVELAGEGIAAGEIVLDERVVRLHFGEALVDFEPEGVFAALGVIVAEDLQGVDILRIAADQPFQEPYFNIQVALFLAVERLAGGLRFRLRHTLHPDHFTPYPDVKERPRLLGGFPYKLIREDSAADIFVTFVSNPAINR